MPASTLQVRRPSKQLDFVLNISFASVASLVSRIVTSPLHLSESRGIHPHLRYFVEYDAALKPYIRYQLLKRGCREGLVFALKEAHRRSLGTPAEKDVRTRWVLNNFWSGALAGFGALVVLHLFEYPKRLMAHDNLSMSYKGEGVTDKMMTTYPKYIAAQGPFSIYRGFLISLSSAALFRGMQFGIFDSFKGLFGDYPLNFLPHLLLGTLSTAAALTTSYPFELVRRRWMVTPGK